MEIEKKSNLIPFPDPKDRPPRRLEGGERGMIARFPDKRKSEVDDFAIDNDAGAADDEVDKAKKKVMEIKRKMDPRTTIGKVNLWLDGSNQLNLSIKFNQNNPALRDSIKSVHVKL